MKEMKFRKRKTTLLFTTVVALLAVLSLGVSTYAWFQANADVQIATESESAEITVSAPDDMVKFYYFKGNGEPGTSEYTGYSKYDAAYGNKTNLVNTATSPAQFKTSALNYSPITSNSWGLIDKDSDDTTSGEASAANCFDFSRMRVGCYYSFMIETSLATTKVDINYDWSGGNGITGDSFATKRRVNSTSYPINLLMAINGYCVATNTNDGAGFITNSLNSSLTDLITYSGDNQTSSSYRLLGTTTPDAGEITSTDKYIFFTIFMGMPDKSDAFSYVSTDGDYQYYQADGTYGNYSVFDGLKTTLTSILVS